MLIGMIAVELISIITKHNEKKLINIGEKLNKK